MMNSDDRDKLQKQEAINQRLEIQEVLTQLPEEMLIAALKERHVEIEGSGNVVQMVARRFSGPLPSPEMLQGYENTHSGLADRIVAMAENEQQHRHKLEVKSVDGAINKEKRGQRYALFIAYLIISISGVLVYLGHPVSASIFGGVTLATLVGLFLDSKRKEKQKNLKASTED